MIISGIQQIGIGVRNIEEASAWYNRCFGFDIPVFREAASAPLMIRYTGGDVHTRDALLALNLSGGGGMEIWQYTSRQPQAAQTIQITDYGILAVRIKTPNVQSAYNRFLSLHLELSDSIYVDAVGSSYFYLRDPWGNVFHIVESKSWFQKPVMGIGGIEGVLIGVSDLAASVSFYQTLLGFHTTLYDYTSDSSDLAIFSGIHPSIKRTVRRVLLDKQAGSVGPFCELLGRNKIELIHVPGGKGQRIFANRLWGDLGFIHLCFDVVGMAEVERFCDKHGFPFTVNSGSHFDMGEAAGHFAYIEDPDGTLIEFVETYRIPIVKAVRWYLNVKKRNGQPLPRWILQMLRFTRTRV